MSKSIKLNYVYNLIFQLLAIAIPLITMPYVSRVLLPDGVGAYSYADSIVYYFVLFAILGTNIYGQREISYVQHNRSERTHIFWNIVALRGISSLVMLVLFLVFALFQDEYKILYIVLSLNVVNVACDITWLLQGMEEFKTITIRNIVVKLAFTAYIFIVIKQPEDLWLYALGIAGSTIIGNVSIWPTVSKYVDPIKFNMIRPFSGFTTVLSLFIPSIAISIYTVLDKTMIGFIVNDFAQNGYYEQAMKISRTTLMVVSSLGTVMVPRIGHLYSTGEHEELRGYLYKSYQFVWFLGIPLCFGLLALSGNIIPWFLGDSFLPAIPVLQASSFLILAIGINNVTGIQYLIPTKRQNAFTLTVLIGSAINVLLNIVLIPKMLALGAALSSVLAETAIAIVQLVYIRKELSFKRIIRSSVRYLCAGVVMLSVLSIADNALGPSPASSVLLISVGFFIYIASLFILRDPFLKNQIRQIRQKRL